VVKVSIVIPTRNRAHLLYYALRSALKQTFDDFEVVVCDNFSKDETAELTHRHANPKIVYTRTSMPLSMPDNWEYALRYARGEYITFLTDDSYLLSDALTVAMTEVERAKAQVAVWKHSAYFSSAWLEPARRNLLYVPRATSKSFMLDSQRGLRELYNNPQQPLVPKALNSICHRSVIEKVISVQGRFFLPSCPDYTSAAGVLLNVPEYLFIDRPLFIDGVTTASIGANVQFNGGASAQDFLKEFGQDLSEVLFLGIPTCTAGIAMSLEGVKKYYPGACPPLNKNKVLNRVVDDLARLQVNGVNVGEHWKTINRHLANQPNSVRFSAATQRVVSALKWHTVRIVRSSPRLELLEKLRGIEIISGAGAGFSNIEESSKVVMNQLAKVRSPDPSTRRAEA